MGVKRGERRPSNVQAVEAVLDSMRRDGPLSTADEAHGRLALTLAAELDAVASGGRDTYREDRYGDRTWTLAPGSGTAALAKELRAALAALAKVTDAGDDDIFGSDLPSEVRDSPES